MAENIYKMVDFKNIASLANTRIWKKNLIRAMTV